MTRGVTCDLWVATLAEEVLLSVLLLTGTLVPWFATRPPA